MNKSLTEKWKDGELSDGYYYIKLLENDEPYIHKKDYWAKEVPVTFCEPVPSYKENKKLQEQLKEANEIISSLKDARSSIVDEYIKKWGVK